MLSEVDESKQNLCFQPEVEYTGAPGRPKICVTKDQLSYLVDNGFKATDMARMLGISDATVHRRLKILTFKFLIHFLLLTIMPWIVLFVASRKNSPIVAIEWFVVA